MWSITIPGEKCPYKDSKKMCWQNECIGHPCTVQLCPIKARNNTSFLSQALNEGDGVYRP